MLHQSRLIFLLLVVGIIPLISTIGGDLLVGLAAGLLGGGLAGARAGGRARQRGRGASAAGNIF